MTAANVLKQIKENDVIKLQEYLDKAKKLSGNLTFEEAVEYTILPQLELLIKREKLFLKS